MINNIRLGNVGIVETGISYGNMNTAARFYPEGTSAEERQRIFMERRMKVGEDFGFDGHKMFMADQTDKCGTWFEIDEDYVEANPNGWSDISEDILVITDRVPGVVIGHPVADCPVVMAFDIIQELKALASKEDHYRQEYNKKLESLQKRKRKDKKKKIQIENKISNNKSSVISAKNNNFLSTYNDIQTELTKKTSEDIALSEKMTAKSINFQKQSLYLAEKNEIENDYNEKITQCNNQKTKLIEKHKKMNNEIKYWDAINKKEKSKLEQRIKALSTYYYQILKKGIDVRNSGLTWVIVKLLELGAFVDKPHFPSFLNDEQILYLMKIGTKTYELSEYIKLFQILKKKQKTLREKHINDNIKKEKMNQIQKYKNNKKKKKDKNFMIGDDYMIYIEEIQRKYENVINICLNENREESNIAKISNDLKQYILNNKEEEEEEQKNNKNRSSKKLELLFIPGSLSEYFAQDKRFRQYFDDVFYLNDEINKRRDNLNKEKQDYLNQYKNNILRGALFGNTDIGDKYKSKKSKENEVVYAALFGNGISI